MESVTLQCVMYPRNCTMNRDCCMDAGEVRKVSEGQIANAVFVPEQPSPKPMASTGGATGYYDLPKSASTLNDLIEAKEMSFARGNIFKACYRLGEKEGVDHIYDLNKIIYFAERLKEMAKKGKPL